MFRPSPAGKTNFWPNKLSRPCAERPPETTTSFIFIDFGLIWDRFLVILGTILRPKILKKCMKIGHFRVKFSL